MKTARPLMSLVLLLGAAASASAAGLRLTALTGSLSVALPGKAPLVVRAGDKTPLPLGATVRVSGGQAEFSARGGILSVLDGSVILVDALKGRPRVSVVSGAVHIQAGGNSVVLPPGASAVLHRDGTVVLVSGRADTRRWDGKTDPLYAGETLKPAPEGLASVLVPLPQ
jgi:hypothetical protein